MATRTTAHRRLGRPRDGANDVAILDAVEQLLGHRGYEAMTMEQIAAEAGVSKPTIYLRYGSKRELVLAMIDRLQPPLPTTSTGSTVDDLEALIDMQRGWIDQHGSRIVAAVLLEETDHPELMDRFHERVVEPLRVAFRLVLRTGIDRGELRPGADREEVIDALTGAYVARPWSTRPRSKRWSRRLIDTMLLGLTPRTTD